MAPLLEIQRVSKTFRIPAVRRHTVREHVLDFFRPGHFQSLRVLDDVTFSVGEGETIGIMGRNGCGKSTLLKIIAGIYQPDSGRVIARGPITPILELGVGWNPQLDAVDNICLIGSVMGMSLRQIRDATAEILAFAELERFANMKLQHYSSGMASRLAYAVAFQAVREILVLDEVFAVGDAGFRTRCEERYRQLHREGHTVLIVSHDARVISGFCDRAILLDSGGLLVDGSPATVVEAYLRLLKGPASEPVGAARATIEPAAGGAA
jgi:ABC-type polysaccharide/polyol phosphate transport system ATPase subunit